MSERGRGISAAIFLAACLFLGGASAAGAIANALLQIGAVVMIVTVLWTSEGPLLPREARGLAWIIGLFLLLNLFYLLPLPASLWEQLPGRGTTARGFDLIGVQDPAIPVSLAPDRTATSLLWLLPPVAIFLAVIQLSARWRRRIGWVVLAAAILSIALSAFQMLGGEGSPLRFYQITNPNRAVGFFASANHLPTLIVCALPFAGLLAARAVKSGSSQAKGGGITLSVSLALFLAVGIAFSGSMAGFALFLPAALATFLIYRRAAIGRLSRGWALAVSALFVAFAVVATQGPLNQQALSDKFSEHATSRKTIWSTSARAAQDFAPVGSGLGTFPAVYRTFDDPGRASHEFVNHAHNDYLEIALELGIAGLLLVILFLVWWTRRALRAWAEDFEGAALARAGSVIIGLVLLHSIGDYPLRTSALASVFALGAAFLVPAPVTRRRRSEGSTEQPSGGPRHLEAD